VTQRPAVTQLLVPTANFATDEQEGKLALHRRYPTLTAPTTQ